jgi:hypothetical protein
LANIWRRFVSKTLKRLAVAGLGILLAASPAAAQQQQQTDEHVRALIAQVTQGGAQLPPAFGQAQGPVVNLTEQEAVDRATQYNLTLASERITPQTWDYSMAATRANYVPNLTSSFGNVNRTSLSTNALQGGLRTTSEQQSWSGGLQQSLWRGGGSYSINWTNSRDTTSSTNSTCNPCFSSGLQAQFTQPLLQNRAIDNTRAAILSNEINQSIALLNLSGSEVSILAQVRNAYWELVFARRRSRPRTSPMTSPEQAGAGQPGARRDRHHGADRHRAGAGRTGQPPPAGRHRGGHASQQRAGAQAPDRQRHRRHLWNATIVPVDRPRVTEQPLDLEAAVRTALSQRTDLAVSARTWNRPTSRCAASRTRRCRRSISSRRWT